MPAGLCASAGREARRRRATRPAPMSACRFIVSSRVGSVRNVAEFSARAPALSSLPTRPSLHEFLPRLHTRFTPSRHLPSVPVMSTHHPGRLAMQTAHHARIRLGALGLGLSALLLMVFPLARPFFRMDIFAPEETMAAASPAFASVAWMLSHYLAMLGFVLLLGGMLALYAFHAGPETEPRAFRGLLWGIMGVALILPAFGVEAFTMPAIGKLHLDGVTGLAPMIPLTYRGPMTIVLTIGLALWLPLLPKPVRIIDGLLIGLGGIPLAWSMWRNAAQARSFLSASTVCAGSGRRV